MLEAYGNLWDIASEGKWDAIVITTNGYVRNDGQAVLGRGIAKEARDRYPGFALELGTRLRQFGNHTNVLYGYDDRFDIITLPVKPAFFGKDHQPGWKSKAQLPLIMQSIGEMLYFVDRYHWMDILMPRPGCGNGGLLWENVRPKIEFMLDSRFTVVNFHP